MSGQLSSTGGFLGGLLSSDERRAFEALVVLSVDLSRSSLLYLNTSHQVSGLRRL